MYKNKLLSGSLIALVYVAASLPCSITIGQSSNFQKVREWRSGKYTVEATIYSANSEQVTLLRHQTDKEDKRVRLPVERLSEADQKHARGFAEARFKEIKKVEDLSAVAAECFSQFKEYVDQGFVDDTNRLFVEARMEALEAHSKSKRVLVKETYLTPEQFLELQKESAEKTREWLKGQATKSTKVLRGITADDPSCLTASLLLGIYYDIYKGDAKAAENVLEEAVEQGKRYRAVASEADRRNLYAAINNLAVAHVRQGRVPNAVKLWGEIVDSEFSGNAGIVKANIKRVTNLVDKKFSGLTANKRKKQDLSRLLSAEFFKSQRVVTSGGWGVVLPVDQQLVELNNVRFLVGEPRFQKIASGAIFDTRCVKCQGTDIHRCPREGCRKGKIEERIMDDVYAPNGQFLGRKVVKVNQLRCPTCGGDGFVPCPGCQKGSQR